jgi:hypothetical protein
MKSPVSAGNQRSRVKTIGRLFRNERVNAREYRANARVIDAATDLLHALTGPENDGPELYRLAWLEVLLRAWRSKQLVFLERNGVSRASQEALFTELEALARDGRSAVARALPQRVHRLRR